MSDKYPDCYYKMAKKIAQLTKVIFQLHTKTLDNEELISSLRRGYEREIDSIVKEADGIITRQRTAIQAQAEGAANPKQLEELRSQHEGDKQRFLKELEQYKQTVTDREAKTTQEHEAELGRFRKSVDELRNKYELKLNAMGLQIRAMEPYKKSVEDLRHLHKTELENLVKEHNRKYNELAKAKLASEDKLTEDFAKEKAQLAAQYEKRISDVLLKAGGDEQLRLRIQQQKKELEDSAAKMKRDLEEKLAAALVLAKDWERKTQETEESNRALLHEIQQEKASQGELARLLEGEKAETENAKKALENAQTESKHELDKLLTQVGQQLEVISERDKELATVTSQLQELMAKSVRENGSAQEELQKKAARIEQLEFANKRLLQRVDELERRLRDLDEGSHSEKDRLQTRVAELEQENAQLKSDSQNVLNIVTDELEGKRKDLEELLAKQRATETKLENERKRHEAETRMGEETRQREIAELMAKCKVEQDRLSDQHTLETNELRNQIEQCKAAMTSENEELKGSLQKHIVELESQLNSMKAAHAAKLSELNSILAATKTELQQTKEELAEAREKLQVKKKEIARQDEQIAELKQRVESAKKQHEKELEDLRESFEGNQQVGQEALKKQFELQRQKFIENAQVQADVAKAKFDQRMAELRFDYEKLLRAKEASSQAMLAEKNAEIEKAQEEIAQRNLTIVGLKDAHEKTLLDLSEKHKAELLALSKRYGQTAEMLEKIKDEELDKLRAQLDEERKRALKEQQAGFEKKLQQQKEQAETAIHALATKCDDTIRNMQGEKGSMETEFNAKITAMQEESAKRERDAKYQLEVLAEDLANAQKIKCRLERELTELIVKHDDAEKELARATSENENLKKNHHDEMHSILVKKEKELLDAEMQHKMETANLVREHLAETEDLQRQFGGVQELMDKKHKQLEEKLEEMQNLYDTRPSRNEDLELVKQLQEQCMMKDNAIRKAAEDMKFYKLELINREENYNKVFGVKPVIGIFNPLEKKETAGQAKENLGTAGGKRKKIQPIQPPSQ